MAGTLARKVNQPHHLFGRTDADCREELVADTTDINDPLALFYAKLCATIRDDRPGPVRRLVWWAVNERSSTLPYDFTLADCRQALDVPVRAIAHIEPS